jgi:hypothetical protein
MANLVYNNFTSSSGLRRKKYKEVTFNTCLKVLKKNLHIKCSSTLHIFLKYSAGEFRHQNRRCVPLNMGMATIWRLVDVCIMPVLTLWSKDSHPSRNTTDPNHTRQHTKDIKNNTIGGTNDRNINPRH